MVLKGYGSYNKGTKQPNKPSPVSNIGRIGSLNRYPDKEYANSLLHDVAKLVAPIIHENNFKVGTLCEMFPNDPNLLGLNVNRGQKILLRLRYHSNDRSFYPMSDIVGTFLHELTHNLYGAHDQKFYDFLDKLKKRFEEIQYGGGANMNYRCEEERLGSKYDAFSNAATIRDKRLKELSKPKYKAEVRVLGSGSSLGPGKARPTNTGPIDPVQKQRQLRLLMLEAAERRQRDSKWCHSEAVGKEEVPDDADLDIIEIGDDDDDGDNGSARKVQKVQNDSNKTNVKEVVDLTKDEENDNKLVDNEIVVIDG
ncbi:uncharacterized protein J8A68_002260 [[Candida] subhashii]|uniref:WLM domain-containing protein n=1 Tax=[Candida] subhashii TaxID=561895 RepID=A0A8J5QJF6_9ASCO|nr:uncharacterized protein J8A68_002260 [[Candida] subhashii]KAG7664197.1 hypothetical protein J8A68_002260 [[Candida] subhashii]